MRDHTDSHGLLLSDDNSDNKNNHIHEKGETVVTIQAQEKGNETLSGRSNVNTIRSRNNRTVSTTFKSQEPAWLRNYQAPRQETASRIALKKLCEKINAIRVDPKHARNRDMRQMMESSLAWQEKKGLPHWSTNDINTSKKKTKNSANGDKKQDPDDNDNDEEEDAKYIVPSYESDDKENDNDGGHRSSSSDDDDGGRGNRAWQSHLHSAEDDPETVKDDGLVQVG